MRVLRRFDRIVAPSPFLANELGGFCPSIIPNVVNVDAYQFELRQILEPRLLWMRAFHSIYNPAMALKCFAIILHDRPGATLVMAGVDKGLESDMRSMARDMKIEHAVRFPGFLDHKAKVREFSDADIYLNTNRIDNMPVSVIEACAMGLPVVATNVGGLPHLITNGVNGLLVPDDDAEAMAGAVNRVLNDPDLARRLSENGRLLAERSAWTSVRKLWDELFTDVLMRRQQRKGVMPKLLERSSG
jgi:glycosyltransferase involved in cell wall biosynthesis